MSKFFILLAGILLFTGLSVANSVAAEQNKQRAQYYGALLGRAVACGISVDRHSYLVLAWIDSTFREEAPNVANLFLGAAAESARGQKDGLYPENCDQVKATMEHVQWPSFNFSPYQGR